MTSKIHKSIISLHLYIHVLSVYSDLLFENECRVTSVSCYVSFVFRCVRARDIVTELVYLFNASNMFKYIGVTPGFV